MNTSDYAAVAAMYFRAVAPALGKLTMVLLYVKIRIHSKEERIKY